MPYVSPARKTKVTGQPNNFAGQKTDGNRVAMNYGNIMQTQDNTGTPVTSPATVNTTLTLIVPPGATQCTVTSVTNAVQVSEDSSQTAFFSLPAGQILTFDCADMANVYLKTASSTVVSFFFKVV